MKDSLLQQALAASGADWSALLSLVEKIGQVVYNRTTAEPLLQVEIKSFSI